MLGVEKEALIEKEGLADKGGLIEEGGVIISKTIGIEISLDKAISTRYKLKYYYTRVKISLYIA